MAENDWRAGLPDDLKTHESLKDIKDVAGLAKVYVDTKAHVGNSLRLPGPEASAEERAAFVGKLQEKYPDTVYLPKTPEEAAGLEKQIWNKLGRPEDPKGYDLNGVDLGGVELPVERMAAAAHELGLTKAQFQTLARKAAKEQADAAKAHKDQQDALKKEWGAAWGEKTAAASEIAKKFGAEPKSVAELKAWAAVAAAVGGSGRQVAEQTGSAPKLTPDEAKIRLQELGRNPAFWNGTGPEHDALVAKQRELMQQAYPDLVGQPA